MSGDEGWAGLGGFAGWGCMIAGVEMVGGKGTYFRDGGEGRKVLGAGISSWGLVLIYKFRDRGGDVSVYVCVGVLPYAEQGLIHWTNLGYVW